MVQAARVLDESRLESRARIGDVMAVGLLVVVGSALLYNMYSLGFNAYQASSQGGGLVFERDRAFTQGIIEAAIVALALGWIVYRLFSRSAKRSGG